MTVEELFASHTPEVRDLAERVRDMLLSFYPDVVEKVDSGNHLITYGSGTKMAEQIWYIAPFKEHVNLGFMRGADLDDPGNMLEGTGKKMRHVKVRSIHDIARVEFLGLILTSFDAVQE